MIEVLETGMPGKTMVYVTVDEVALREKLFNLKLEAAIYYDKTGRKTSYHWLLNPVTIEKWGLKDRLQKLTTE